MSAINSPSAYGIALFHSFYGLAGSAFAIIEGNYLLDKVDSLIAGYRPAPIAPITYPIVPYTMGIITIIAGYRLANLSLKKLDDMYTSLETYNTAKKIHDGLHLSILQLTCMNVVTIALLKYSPKPHIHQVFFSGIFLNLKYGYQRYHFLREKTLALRDSLATDPVSNARQIKSLDPLLKYLFRIHYPA